MYSQTIKPKVDQLFKNLEKKAFATVDASSTYTEAAERVTKLVSYELASRSKSILSDMLSDLFDEQMKTEFFSDIARQNRFDETNLRYEIMSKYRFDKRTSVDYKEASEDSKRMRALSVGGATLAVGGAAKLGFALVSRLSQAAIAPIPVIAIIAVSIGAALANYCVVAPSKNKKNLECALVNYLKETKQQFLKWFDEVEKYFNKRVEEIKEEIEAENL